MNASDIAVIGSGGWGTALASHLAHAGHRVRLWGRDSRLIAELARSRVNTIYLPDVTLPDGVIPVSDLDAAVTQAGLIVAAVPSHGLRDVARAMTPSLRGGVTLVSATKGIEEGSLFRMSEVLRQECGERHPIVVLSGPSFAAELARSLPTAVVAASRDDRAVARILEQFRSGYLRLYGSDDVVGVELGGAMKNVIAIAVGAADGLGLGFNAKAGLITRGLAEIARLADAEGGRRETLAGLAGLGDLVLTCTGALSRNRQFGIELGRGRRADEIVAGMKAVAEGVRTASAALAIGARRGLELPITERVAAVIAGRMTPQAVVTELMDRPQRPEAG
jgi:glycerol-3-phosphate dehydrogenase (NAD(P)+)